MPLPIPRQLPRDLQQMLLLTEALIDSGSRLEDAWWEQQLTEHAHKLLTGKANTQAEMLLEHLAEHAMDAYEILFEKIESLSESINFEHEGTHYNALLISAPIIAWSRYRLPGGELSNEQYELLQHLLVNTVANQHTKVYLAPHLLEYDDLPQSFHETRQWTETFAQAALGLNKKAGKLTRAAKADAESMLADTRFIIGVIVAPAGSASFSWQTAISKRAQLKKKIAATWVQRCTEILNINFTGCQTEFLPPDAYYTNNRESDQKMRPFVLRAALHWLHLATKVPTSDMQIVLVACGTDTIQEYRIGICAGDESQVIYGCVWPLLTRDEAFNEVLESSNPSMADEILTLVKAEGITNIQHLPGLYACETCEDCGAPYFPNGLGEMQHPELPDDAYLEPIQLH